jgi:hypothetical protein
MNTPAIRFPRFMLVVTCLLMPLFPSMHGNTFAQVDDQQADEPHQEETPPQTGNLVKPEAKLTSAQLAKWKPAYQPLELLGVRKQTSFVTCVAAIPSDSRYLLAGRHVTLWSIQKTQPDHVFEWKWIPNAYMVAMAVAPDGKWFVTADCLGKVYRFDLTTRKLTVVKDIHMFDITDVAISPDGKDIAVLQRELGKWGVSIFDSRRITFKSKLSSNPKKNPDSNDFSMAPLQPEVANRLEYIDNDRLLVMGARFSVLNTSLGALETKVVKNKFPSTCGSLNDGKRFFTVYDTSIDFFEKETLAIRESYPQWCNPNLLLAFSPDDRYFARLSDQRLEIIETQTKDSLQRLRVDIDRENQSIGMLWLPTENVLIVVEQHGAIRIWGTKAEGMRLGLNLLKDSLNPEVSNRIPATTIEAQTVLDFGKMPIPQNSTNVSSTIDKFYCRAPLDLESSKLFYRYHLREMGWLEDISDTEKSEPNSILFQKGAFKVRASFNEIDSVLTQIKFTYASNFDLRLAPRLEGDIQLEQESEDSVVYQTSADLLKIECGLLRVMKKDGWILFEHAASDRFNEFLSATAPERKLTFIKNGIILAVAVGKSKSEPTSSTIEYVRWITEYSVPVPPQTNYLEFNDHAIGFTVLAFMKSSDLKAYYDKELQRQGWIVMPESGTPFPDMYCANYIYQQQDLQLTFRQHSGGLSSVYAYSGDNTFQMTRLIYRDAPNDHYVKPVTEYCSFTRWLARQKYEPGYDSIDRYEKEMRAILDKQVK